MVGSATFPRRTSRGACRIVARIQGAPWRGCICSVGCVIVSWSCRRRARGPRCAAATQQCWCSADRGHGDKRRDRDGAWDGGVGSGATCLLGVRWRLRSLHYRYNRLVHARGRAGYGGRNSPSLAGQGDVAWLSWTPEPRSANSSPPGAPRSALTRPACPAAAGGPGPRRTAPCRPPHHRRTRGTVHRRTFQVYRAIQRAGSEPPAPG